MRYATEISVRGNILSDLEDAMSKKEFLLLSRCVLSNAISRCLNLEILEDVLSKWAGEIELAENVIYENGYQKEISDVLFCLASREINSNISLNKLLLILK